MHTASLAQRYDTLAPRWSDILSRLGWDDAYDQLVADASPTARLLDAGCGSGALTAAYLKAAPADHVTLLDPSEAMLTEAQTRLASPAECLCAGMGTHHLSDQFDTILVGHVIEHLPEPGRSIRWLRERLRPGGRLYLSVSRPHWCTWLVRQRWSHRAFEPDCVVDMLHAAGFDTVEVVPFSSGPPARLSCGFRASDG